MKKFLLYSLISFGCIQTSYGAMAHIEGHVTQLRVDPTTYYVKLDNPQCMSATDLFYFSATDPRAKEWYAMLLVAANSKNPVSIRIAECSAAGNKQVNYIYQNVN